MATEAEVIARSGRPATTATLIADLRSLGLREGGVAIVHCSLSALGWIAGGAQAVVEALLATVGPTGTIVMPTQSGQLSDPATWGAPPVPPDWVADVRAGLPAYDPELTPTRGMGAVVECFRSLHSTLRSRHPLVSFAANGAHADAITATHPLSPAFGDTSPLGRLYEMDADVVLLGVGHGSNTSLHLAEFRADWPGRAATSQGAPVLVDGERTWVTFGDLDYDDDDFDAVGAAFAATGSQTTGIVGAGVAHRCSQRAVVDFATTWLAHHRSP